MTDEASDPAVIDRANLERRRERIAADHEASVIQTSVVVGFVQSATRCPGGMVTVPSAKRYAPPGRGSLRGVV